MNIPGHSVGASSRWWEQKYEKHASLASDRLRRRTVSSLAEEERVVWGVATGVEKTGKIWRSTRAQALII